MRGVRAVRSRLTIETMSLSALYLRYTRNYVLNDPVSRDEILRRKRGEVNINFPSPVNHEQDWQPYFYQVDPYSLCGVMGGRKRRGRPGILAAIFMLFSSIS